MVHLEETSMDPIILEFFEIPEGSAVPMLLAVNNILGRSTLYTITALSHFPVDT
jgi:hypothetical protein